MTPEQFTEAALKLFVTSFKPAEDWRGEILDAIRHLTAAQLDAGLRTLKRTRGGKRVTVQILVNVCETSLSIGPSPEPSQPLHAALRRAPGAYIEPFRAFMRVQNLWDQYQRSPMDQQVMISRLYAELWGGSHGEDDMLDIAGSDERPWIRISRLFEGAQARADDLRLVNKRRSLWYPTWSDPALATNFEVRR